MITLALSDSDLIALSILVTSFSAVAVIGGSLFWIMFRNNRKAKQELDLFQGLENLENYEPEPTRGKENQQRQAWEKDADWWKE